MGFGLLTVNCFVCVPMWRICRKGKITVAKDLITNFGL